MKIKNIATALLLAAALQSCVVEVPKREYSNNREQRYFIPLPPPAPESVVFAGEEVLIDKEDRVERLDRELLSFTYSQASTVTALKRAGKIFPQIEPILKQYGIPDDLKYLAVIESTLSIGARSYAGATGLWQFMPATAREFGLVVNDYIDERYNLERETVAACKYLKKAYKRFGDWMTVAASYNAGMKGINDKLDRQLVENGMDLWLVEETSRYMFRLLAAKMLFDDPAQFGYKLGSRDVYHYKEPRERITVSHTIRNLATFAKEHNCSYGAFRRANLWIRTDALINPTGKSYTITIP